MPRRLAGPGRSACLCRRCRNARALAAFAGFLDGIEHSAGRAPVRLVPMIENPGALLDARSIATATPRNFALTTGGEDIATSLGAEPTPEVLHVSEAHGALRRQGRRPALVRADAHRRRL